MTIANACRSLILALVLTLGAHNASAQIATNLPPSIVQSGTVNATSRQQIQDYVAALSEPVKSKDLRDATRARDQLIKPLTDRDVSVAFRQAYAQALASLMSDLDATGEVDHQLTALRLAGELGTTESVRAIRNHLNSDDDGIQLFAIGRAQRVFEITSAHGPAISAPEATNLIRALTDMSSSQTDPLMIDAIVRALAAGTSLPGSDLSAPRNQSIQSLAKIVSPLLQKLEPDQSPEIPYRFALRASSAITVSVTDVNATITPESTLAAIGLAGDMLAVPLRQIISGAAPNESERGLSARAVQSGEALMYFARRKHATLTNANPASIEQTTYADLIRSGDNRAYRNQVALMLGANSEIVRLIKAEPNRFVR